MAIFPETESVSLEYLGHEPLRRGGLTLNYKINVVINDFYLESLQNVRKHRTIQADKLRSLECSFLANYIVDFHRNRRKCEEQMNTLSQDCSTDGRDELWRAKSTLKKS